MHSFPAGAPHCIIFAIRCTVPPLPPQSKTKVSKVQLRAGEDIEGAFLFVGDKSTNNGMDNKACAIVSGTPCSTNTNGGS